jgi:PAS domain S-box-containing protein
LPTPEVRALLDAMVEAFVLIDVVGCVVEWNLAAERTFGWSRAEALGSVTSTAASACS